MTYKPQPIDTSEVELSSDIESLTEQLAEHAHEVWAELRTAQGWTYGPARDDSAKKHPCLVPYNELDESEKDFDRNTALQTLKVIRSLGYQIVSPDVSSSGQSCEFVQEQLRLENPEVATLLPIWQNRDPELPVWKQPDTYITLARHFIDLGVPFSAREVADTGLPFSMGQKRLQLRHLKGLSLARSGAVEAASRVLCDEELSGLQRDEELLGLEAAMQKQLGLQASAPEDRRRHLCQARDLYHTAWKAPDGTFWTGINVASMHLLLGDEQQASSVAREVETACLAEDDRKRGSEGDDPYWRWVTLGEACLNQGLLDKAEEWYRRAAAVEISRNRVGHLNASRRQLRWLFHATGRDESLVDEWLPIPGVAVFTGHRIDDSSRAVSRFPPGLEPQIKAAITQWLASSNVRAGVSSAANGADILFLEALQELEGSDTRIVLPFSEKEFIETSVRNGADESWVSRFQTVIDRATRVTIAASDRVGTGRGPFEYANRIILGQGLMLAQELQSSLCGLAVWNGESEESPGGTADTVERWRQQQLTVHTVDLSNAVSAVEPPQPLSIHCEGTDCSTQPVPVRSELATTTNDGTPTLSMLFADAVGFSKLTDREVELFINHFLGRVAQCVEKYAPAIKVQPELWDNTSIPVRETWGDGLYFAISDVQTAGCFALDLCDAIRETPWREEFGFSTDLEIRIALHCGPVHLSHDPITGLPKCTGTHVSRAARLEPRTPPNHVYASEAFASLVAEERITDFTCDFVKLLGWAKSYGTFPTYVVTRK